MILDFLFRNSGGGSRTITTPRELAKLLTESGSTASGVSVTPENAIYLAAVAACIRVLAESVGQLPVHMLQRDGEKTAKALKHPLYTLLHDAPNEFQTAQEWREWLLACLGLRGNAYSQIIRVGARTNRRVVELLPLPPTSVRPQQDPNTREVRYEISLPNGKTKVLPAEEVLHIKLFSLDGLMGMNPIQYARETIGLAKATERHGAGLFANGASPGGVLQTEKTLDETSRDNLRDSWNGRHGGPDNAGKVAVLEDGLKWQSVTMSSLDAQWLESRKFQRSEIAGIFRVPPHLIGDLERATFSNIEHQGLDFVVHTLMPYLVRLEQRVQMQLLTAEERPTYYAKTNVAGLLRGDMAARAAFYQQLVSMGALSPNEVRAFEDMNPREGGDTFLTPANMLHDGKLPASAKKTAP